MVSMWHALTRSTYLPSGPALAALGSCRMYNDNLWVLETMELSDWRREKAVLFRVGKEDVVPDGVDTLDVEPSSPIGSVGALDL